jgi:fatty acid desaturase
VVLGLPLAVFAWVWSLLLYVYHYGATTGPDVRHNVRSLPRQRFFSWLLLNFNEHATHHYDPAIPWHQLPERRHILPPSYHQNENVTSLWQAVWQQRKGPRIEEIAEVGEFSIDLGLMKR